MGNFLRRLPLPPEVKHWSLTTLRENQGAAPLPWPVNRKFLFYAMHKLVSDFPQESLSDQAKQAHQRYLDKASNMGVSAGKKIEVTSWGGLNQSFWAVGQPGQGLAVGDTVIGTQTGEVMAERVQTALFGVVKGTYLAQLLYAF